MVIKHQDGELRLKNDKIFGFGTGLDSSTKLIILYIDSQEPILFRCGDRHATYSLTDDQYYELVGSLKKLPIESLLGE